MAKYSFEDYRLRILEALRTREDITDSALDELDDIWLGLSPEDRARTEVYDFKADLRKITIGEKDAN